MALVLARHPVFGVCEVGEQTVAAFPDDWTLVDPAEPAAVAEDLHDASPVATGDPSDVAGAHPSPSAELDV